MDVDQQIREVLRDRLVQVDDVTTARRQIRQRAANIRRRRRWLRASALSAAAAAVVAVVAALLWTAQPAVDRPPIIAPTPAPSPTHLQSDGPANAACADLDVSGQVQQFLDSWTASQNSLIDEACVLAGRHGPQPQFDTQNLGDEQSLRPGDLPDDFELTPTGPMRARAEGYPLVHLGRIGDTDHQPFLEWRLDRLRTPIACVEGSCGADDVPASEQGVIGIGRGSGISGSTLSVTVWVSPEAAVVSLAIDGQPVVWQRPVARTALLFVDDYRPSPDATYQVRVFDRRGQTIATHQGAIDPQ